jgi:cell division protein FtsI/penicillin-binding protein 2
MVSDMFSQKRTLFISVLFIIILIFLTYRLADIQLFSTKSFSKHHINLIEESVNQRTHRFTINDGRGYFLDRNGELLSTDVKPQIVVFPNLYVNTWPIQKIAGILQQNPENITSMILHLTKPSTLPIQQDITVEQMNEINSLEIPGLYAQLITRRKPLPFANHILGAVGEDPDLIMKKYPDKWEKGAISLSTKTGKNGLQYTFDPFIISEGETQFIYHVDRQGHPLFGLDVKYRTQTNPLYPLHVVTTIDKEKQEIVEKAISTYGLEEGGAVLLDIETSELLAMASRPLFTSKTVYEHENKMTTLQIPGSVFKVVTAAAAIEENNIRNDKTYNCNLSINGEEDERQLGMLNFEQSFAQSCNKTFGELANEIEDSKSGTIEIFAKKLGLMQRNGWTGNVYHLDHFSHFYNEETGQIYSLKKSKDDYQNPLAISQTAIGQLDVKVTPLAVANMMATIARGGTFKEVKAATSVNFANGTELIHFEDHTGDSKVLSPYTAMKIQSMLTSVVKDEKGTGHALQSLPFQVAGKSGTAQKGTESILNNKWFAGYFPAEKPRYALVVLDMKHDGTNRTLSVFSAIASEVMNKK